MKKKHAILFSIIFSPAVVYASPRGSEFDITQTPTGGGMSGVGTVLPQDPVAMLFGNPSTLSHVESDNAFTFGASYILIDLDASNNGSNPFAPEFSGSSDLDEAILPSAAFVQRIDKKTIIGFGLTGISGLGSDFRNELSTSAPIVSDLKLFGTNFVIAHQVNSNFSVGSAFTLGIGSLQVGLASNSAVVNATGVGFAVGFDYELANVHIGGKYKSSLSVNYENVTETAPGVYSDFELEQPQEVTFGFSTTDSLWENGFVEVDFRWKNWDEAQGYNGFWKDQMVTSIGGQIERGNWQFRSGYSYSSDILKDAEDLGNNIGDLSQVYIPGAGVVPISPTFIQLFQATATNGYWKQNFSLGIGYKIGENIALDVYSGISFDGEVTISPGLEAEGRVMYIGSGITWRI